MEAKKSKQRSQGIIFISLSNIDFRSQFKLNFLSLNHNSKRRTLNEFDDK